MEPPIPGLEYMPDLPSWSFLVESSTTGKKLLFDLGIPPDWEKFAPVVTEHLHTSGWEISAEKHTSQILEENGVDLGSISAIVWRYVYLTSTPPSPQPTNKQTTFSRWKKTHNCGIHG